jgi:cell division protein FtsQ
MNATMLDPRIRQRRIEVARAAGRRRLHRLITAMALVVAAAVAWAAVHSSLLGVRSVHVVAGAHTSQQDIERAAGLASGRALIDVDTSDIAARVARLPWVDTVHVERDWPSAVRIAVTERTAVASAVGADGKARLLDRTGRVLAVVDDHPPLVRLEGPVPPGSPGQALPPAARLALEVSARLPASLAGQVTALRWATTGAASLTLADRGRQVLLPGSAQLGDALVALIALLQRDDLPPGTIDVRVPSSPVIRSR